MLNSSRYGAGGQSHLHDMSQPLQGLRVVITRAAGRGDGLAARLRELGAEPVIYPVIAHVPPEDVAALHAALQQLAQHEFDWLVLTSTTTVSIVSEWLASALSAEDQNTRIAVVGPATAQACTRLLGQTPVIMPTLFTAAALANMMGDLRGQRVLLLNADIAQPRLQQALQAAGAEVTRVIAYRTVCAESSDVDMAALLRENAVHAVLFTSGSTARYFVERVGVEMLDAMRRLRVVCIGPSTAAVAQQMGLPPDAVAMQATESGLIEALVDLVRMKSKEPPPHFER
jgi:uroporphyrinogen-III synthase